MINKKAIFCIPVKNEASNLKNLFKVLKKLSLIFKDHYYIFVKSNSTDGSYNLIKKFLSSRKGIIIKKRLKKINNRVIRLAICRNTYLKQIKNNRTLKKFDYLIPLDCGNVNNLIDANTFKSIVKKNSKYIAIFPTQAILYYDIWTLRIKNLIEFDCYKEIKNYYLKIGNNIRKKFFDLIGKFLFINFFIKKNKIQVISAFGGIGIYKLQKVINFKYDSNNGLNCEHVQFNLQIYKKYGNKLIIDKNFMNSYGLNIHTFNTLICCISNFFSRRFIKKIL